MAEQISDQRMGKFVWGEGDIVATDEVFTPDNLKAIIDDIPQDDAQAFSYLQTKVRNKTITLDEFRFILRITADK